MNKIEIVIDRPEQDQLSSILTIDGMVILDMSSFYPRPIKIEDIKKALSLLEARCIEFLETEGVEVGTA